MNRRRRLLLMFGLVMIMTGCKDSIQISSNATQNDFDFVGYIVQIKDSKLLVVSDQQDENNFYDAVWVTTKINKEKLGQKVGVIFDGNLASSYPALGLAKSVTILKIENKSITHLTPEEVLEKGLSIVSDWRLPVVKRISFDSVTNQWTVILINEKSKEKNQKIITIDDQTGSLQ